MLYLDSSALVRRYFKEVGSGALIARATDPTEELFTSVLIYAEVHSVMARKHREGKINAATLHKLREDFESDWVNLFNAVKLNLPTMAALPNLLERYPVKSGDAIQLSIAIWLNKEMEAENQSGAKRVLEFGVADRKLAIAANACGLQVFNPEDEN